MPLLTAMLRRPSGPRPLAPPEGLAAALQERPLGCVPLAEDGSSWAVATAHQLVILSQAPDDQAPDDAARASSRSDPRVRRYPWDEVEHGSWDAERRAFTLRWTDASRPDLVLSVPAGMRSGEGYRECDVADFARALRQRVEAAIIHSATTTLPSGAPASASIRRDARGRLYCITRPAHCDDEADARALRALENRAADGVGLPTR